MKVGNSAQKNTDKVGRPILEPYLEDFVGALAAQRPDSFGHLKARNLLFVAGSARRGARASVRSFALSPHAPGRRPEMFRGPDRVLYEICLRPLFFLDVTPAQRARILAHELWHIAPEFDGGLAPDRRHGECAEEDFERRLQAALEGFDPKATSLWPILCEPGERRLAAWRDRPPSLIPEQGNFRRRYDERDLFEAIVLQL